MGWTESDQLDIATLHAKPYFEDLLWCHTAAEQSRLG
jgi:hypothetical protein